MAEFRPLPSATPASAFDWAFFSRAARTPLPDGRASNRLGTALALACAAACLVALVFCVKELGRYLRLRNAHTSRRGWESRR